MFSPGMSAAVTRTTFDQSIAGSGSIATSRACGSVERIVMPYQAPGKTRSSVYFAAPVSFAGPSRRRGIASARPAATSPGARTSAPAVASAVSGGRATVRLGILRGHSLPGRVTRRGRRRSLPSSGGRATLADAPGGPILFGRLPTVNAGDPVPPSRASLAIDAAIKVATIGLLAWAVLNPGLPQFQGRRLFTRRRRAPSRAGPEAPARNSLFLVE